MPKSRLLRIYCVWILLDVLAFIIYGYAISSTWQTNRWLLGSIFESIFGGLLGSQIQMLGAVFSVIPFCKSNKVFLCYVPFYLMFVFLSQFWRAASISEDAMNVLLVTLFFWIFSVANWFPYVVLSGNSYFILRTSGAKQQDTLSSRFSLQSIFIFTTVVAVFCGVWRIAPQLSFLLILLAEFLLMPMIVAVAFLRKQLDTLTLVIAGAIVVLTALPWTEFNFHQHLSSTIFFITQILSVFSTCIMLRYYDYRLLKESWDELSYNPSRAYTSND